MNIITEDMILRPGRLFRTPVCWNCRHRIHHTPEQIAEFPRITLADDISITDWPKVRVCDRNPIGFMVHGLTRQSCGMWELDGEHWASPSERRHEAEFRMILTQEPEGEE